jgi:hypothetical protein
MSPRRAAVSDGGTQERAVTPWTRASRSTTDSSGENATIGTRGRRADRSRAVRPVRV